MSIIIEIAFFPRSRGVFFVYGEEYSYKWCDYDALDPGGSNNATMFELS